MEPFGGCRRFMPRTASALVVGTSPPARGLFAVGGLTNYWPYYLTALAFHTAATVAGWLVLRRFGFNTRSLTAPDAPRTYGW